VEFHDLFAAAIQASGLSQTEIARRAGDNQSHLNAALRGKRAPPLHRVTAWADALGLNGLDRGAFLLAALRAQVPETQRKAFDAITHRFPVSTGFLAEQQPDAILRLASARNASYDDGDMTLPIAGRAAAARGAHVDGETAQPDPIRIRKHWRAHVIAGDSGLPIVFPGQTVLTDPRLQPHKNRIVVLPTTDGPVLKRWGELADGIVIVASLNGLDPTHYHLADLGQPEVVVGVIFTDSVAR
jgi:transcriptional regulator with XRE-family HTH domain